MSTLAIIIPYYKIDFFEKTIKSLAAQTNKNFTLYIGNDNSPENPLDIIEKYFKPHEYHYFDYPENLGGQNLALQWERILENVSEEWFQVLGDDDVLAPNFVEEFYNALPFCKKNKIHCMKTVHHHIDDLGNLLRINDYHIQTVDAKKFFRDKYSGVFSSSLSENIFKTKLYRKYRFEKIPLAWGSDDIAVLTFSDYNKIFYNRNTYVEVRISESSISGSESLNAKKDDAYNIFREKFLAKHSFHFEEEFVNRVLYHYLKHCYTHKKKAKYAVSLFYLKKLSLISFAKTIKKIWYINAL